MPWSPSPEEIQAAQIALAGGFGAFIRLYIRHPGTLLRAVGLLTIGIGMAFAFVPMLAPLVPLIPVIGRYIEEPEIPAAVLVGLSSISLAEKWLGTVERCDVFPWFSRRKRDDE